MTKMRWECWGLAGVLMAMGAGCAPSPSNLDRGVQAMRRESSPAELAARGDSFAALGDMTRAEQYFAAALKAGAEPSGLVRKLVAVCVADGRYPVAIEYAEDYLRNHPGDVDVRYVAATLRAAVGDAASARHGLRFVLSVRPDLAEAHYALAVLERGEGDPQAADAEFREYLRVDPRGRHAEVARANLLQEVPQ